MSEHMKKPPIDRKSVGSITIMGKKYIVPKKTLQAILTLIQSNPEVKEDTIPYDEIVAEKIKNIGKGPMAMRGARTRESMTQKKLADRLKIDQAIISKIENGQINIDNKLAKNLSKIFNIDYRVFLK
jgi:DNA-binding XRE family transcriptional regulator